MDIAIENCSAWLMEGGHHLNFNKLILKFSNEIENEGFKRFRTHSSKYTSLLFWGFNILTSPPLAIFFGVILSENINPLLASASMAMLLNVLLGWALLIAKERECSQSYIFWMQSIYLIGTSVTAGSSLLLKSINGKCHENDIGWSCNTLSHPVPIDTVCIMLVIPTLGRLVLPDTEWFVVGSAWVAAFVMLIVSAALSGVAGVATFLDHVPFIVLYVVFIALSYAMELRTIRRYISSRQGD